MVSPWRVHCLFNYFVFRRLSQHLAFVFLLFFFMSPVYPHHREKKHCNFLFSKSIIVLFIGQTFILNVNNDKKYTYQIINQIYVICYVFVCTHLYIIVCNKIVSDTQENL